MQDHGKRVRHGLGIHDLSIHLKHAGTGATETAHVVECERSHSKTVVFEIEFNGVLTGSKRIRRFPPNALQVDEVPEEHRFPFEQIKSVTGEPAAGG